MVNVTFHGGHCCLCDMPCMHTNPPTYCDRHNPNIARGTMTTSVMASYTPPKHQTCAERCGCFWRGKYDERGSVIESYEEKIRLAYEQGLKNGRKQGYTDATDVINKFKGEK